MTSVSDVDFRTEMTSWWLQGWLAINTNCEDEHQQFSEKHNLKPDFKSQNRKMERHRSLIAFVITAYYSVIPYIYARVVYGADGVDLRLCACVNDTHV